MGRDDPCRHAEGKARHTTIPTNGDAGPTTVPTSSVTLLVSQTSFNDKGEAEDQVDTAGIITRTTYDAAGRVLSTTWNHGSTPTEVVNMTYNPDGLLKTLTAVNSDTGNRELSAEHAPP